MKRTALLSAMVTLALPCYFCDSCQKIDIITDWFVSVKWFLILQNLILTQDLSSHLFLIKRAKLKCQRQGKGTVKFVVECSLSVF